MALRRLELEGVTAGERVDEIRGRIATLQAAYDASIERLSRLRNAQNTTLVVASAEGREVEIPLDHIVRVYQPNQMSLYAKGRLYGAKLWEFVSGEPRESNTEGGVFPAIFGTVMMVLIMPRDRRSSPRALAAPACRHASAARSATTCCTSPSRTAGKTSFGSCGSRFRCAGSIPLAVSFGERSPTD